MKTTVINKYILLYNSIYMMSRMNGKNTYTHYSSTLLYSSNIRLYPQNSVFEIVHESVKVYLRMYNGNVQQNPLCVEACVTVYSFYPRNHCR